MRRGSRARSKFAWSSPQATESATYLRFAFFLAAALLITGLMEIKRRVEESRNRFEEELRQAHADLAHVNRVTAMGELTASLAHEVRQPITAAVTDANTCMRWLSRDQPDVEEAREAASRVVKDVSRTAEIVTRIRQLFKKGAPQHELVNINELIREMIVLLRSQATRYSISMRTELSEDLGAKLERLLSCQDGHIEESDYKRVAAQSSQAEGASVRDLRARLGCGGEWRPLCEVPDVRHEVQISP